LDIRNLGQPLNYARTQGARRATPLPHCVSETLAFQRSPRTRTAACAPTRRTFDYTSPIGGPRLREALWLVDQIRRKRGPPPACGTGEIPRHAASLDQSSEQPMGPNPPRATVATRRRNRAAWSRCDESARGPLFASASAFGRGSRRPPLPLTVRAAPLARRGTSLGSFSLG
jgi:hypothetical protein